MTPLKKGNTSSRDHRKSQIDFVVIIDLKSSLHLIYQRVKICICLKLLSKSFIFTQGPVQRKPIASSIHCFCSSLLHFLLSAFFFQKTCTDYFFSFILTFSLENNYHALFKRTRNSIGACLTCFSFKEQFSSHLYVMYSDITCILILQSHFLFISKLSTNSITLKEFVCIV